MSQMSESMIAAQMATETEVEQVVDTQVVDTTDMTEVTETVEAAVGDNTQFDTEVVTDIRTSSSVPSTVMPAGSNGKEPNIKYYYHPRRATPETYKRVVCVAFRYDNDNNVAYGASVYRKVDDTDIFTTSVKKGIRETAIFRYKTRPVMYQAIPTEKEKVRYELKSEKKKIRSFFEHHIRKTIPIRKAHSNIDRPKKKFTQPKSVIPVIPVVPVETVVSVETTQV